MSGANSRISVLVAAYTTKASASKRSVKAQNSSCSSRSAASGKIKFPDPPQKRDCAARAASNMVIHGIPSTFAGTSNPNRAGRTDIASPMWEGGETRDRATASP